MLFNPRLNGTFDLVLHYIKIKMAKKLAYQPTVIFVFFQSHRFPYLSQFYDVSNKPIPFN